MRMGCQDLSVWMTTLYFFLRSLFLSLYYRTQLKDPDANWIRRVLCTGEFWNTCGYHVSPMNEKLDEIPLSAGPNCYGN
jgi:hypothetical protein